MKFGYFTHVWAKPGMQPHERYQQLWRELELADQLGFEYGFCVEHHFRPDESWMSAPNMFVVGAGARTKRMRLGGMGHVVPLHHPIRLAEEIALADQMLQGRVEVGLVPGILPDYFRPYGADFVTRREKTLEFVDFLHAAYTDAPHFDFKGKHYQFDRVKLAINPVQRPVPPLWIETRDPPTLEFCAKRGINTGYFFLFDRPSAAPRYRRYLEQWQAAGWTRKPNIAYSTAIYVDETDSKAMARGLREAGRAYRSFFGTVPDDAALRQMLDKQAELFIQRGEPGAAETVRHMDSPEWLFEHDLILVGSPATIVEKLKRWSVEGVFNTFFAECNFGGLAEEDLMRSIRLLGTEVMPALRGFEPF